MATIRNSIKPNVIGDGYEKIITLDNGDEYVLRNSIKPNVIGGGYEQILEKQKPKITFDSTPSGPLTLKDWVAIIYGSVLALTFIIGLFSFIFNPKIGLYCMGISLGLFIIDSIIRCGTIALKIFLAIIFTLIIAALPILICTWSYL